MSLRDSRKRLANQWPLEDTRSGQHIFKFFQQQILKHEACIRNDLYHSRHRGSIYEFLNPDPFDCRQNNGCGMEWDIDWRSCTLTWQGGGGGGDAVPW